MLTMVGALFIFLLVANAVTKHFNEQLTVQVMMADNVEESDVLKLKKQLEGEEYTHEVIYLSKEEAAEMMQEELGEDFLGFLGYNPLPASLDIQIEEGHGSSESLENIRTELQKNPLIDEVVYQKGLLQQVNENMAKWGLGLMIIGLLFLIIAIVLIVNTIELAIFSQRFLIKSMQLVGATHWFIQKPFLKRGLWYGFVSSVFALAILFGLLYYFKNDLQDVITILQDEQRFLILIGLISLTGLIISWLATAYAVRRFVRLDSSKLY